MTAPRLLLLSQVYVPDPASVGQHLHDVAREMVRRGWRVTVICSSRGYDDPGRRYSLYERRDGVEIRRYPLPFFSKSNMPLRVLGSAWAMVALAGMSLMAGAARVVLFSTSPPMVGVLGVLIAALKHARGVYWAMDLNPDQLAAMGKLRESSWPYRLIESVNRVVIRRSGLIIALDRFMESRLRQSPRRPRAIVTMPPWAHEHALEPVPHADNPFRSRHGLGEKFVVMYSGNHTPANPLDTVLNAAVALREDSRICFAFVGGGLEKKRVKAFIAEHRLTNVLELPYQPMSELRHSLGAADVHLVTLGDDVVGIIHPCKVYGAMAVGRPILFIGPRPSHVTDLIEANNIGRAVRHGDTDGCIAAIRELAALPADRLAVIGRTAAAVVARDFSQAKLITRFCDEVERV